MSALAEGHRIGPYRIVRLLGEGGMGAVYEARQEPIDRRVALKTLHPEHAHNTDAIARFFNEAKVLSRLEHPSIVQVSDFGNAPDGSAYLVMEYLRGQSVGSRLAAGNGRLPVVDALQVAWQVADVLAIAHPQEIVHRDLKPDNLMLVADPVAPGGERVKVLDFGIAKLTKASDRGGVKTHTQALMGTPMYMSPEQCAGAGGVDAKSDVYSLGCVLYQMLGGRPPFDGNGAGELIGKHLYQVPVPLGTLAPKVPSAVIELVHRLLIKDKKLRPSMSEAADALGRLLAKLSGAKPASRSRAPVDTDPDSTRQLPALRPSTTLGQSIGEQSVPTLRWRRVLLASAAGVLLIAGSATAWRAQSPSQPLRKTEATPTTAAPASTPPAPPKMTPQSAPPPPPQVHWEVNTEPPGATVVDDTGNQLGKTPWTDEHPRRAGTFKLRLRSDGYSEETLSLDEATDATRKLQLKRLPSPKPPAMKPNLARPLVHPTRPKPTGMTYED